MFEDLHTRGYVHVPSFLSERELKVLQDDYNSQRVLRENENYDLRAISDEPAIAALRPSIESLMSEARAHGIQVDILSGGAYFSTAGKQHFKWHQDHESYYMYQQHYHYLNVYLPVIKPEKHLTNLALLPFDVIAEHCPEMHDKLTGRGATYYFAKDGKTMVYDTEQDRKLGEFPFDIDELAYVPELQEGDLLLLRGDMIHATADTETERCSASIRLINGSGKISKKKFFHGGRNKLNAILKNREAYNYFATYMSRHRRDEFEVSELLAQSAAAARGEAGAFRVRPSMSKQTFRLFMLFNRYIS